MAAQFDEVKISLDRERTLRFDINAMAEVEDALNVPIAEVFADPNKIKVKHLRAILWACLLHEDPHLDLRAAGELVNHAPGKNFSERFNYVVSKITEAVQLAWGTDQVSDGNGAGEKKGADAAPGGTGGGPNP